jgi:hypothetical protein
MRVKNFINGQITTGTEPIDPISGVSRGLYINSVLSGNSSSDTLVGLDINPSYSGTAGNYFGLRVSGDTIFATSGGTLVMRTNNSGYVGFGTNNPTYNLDILTTTGSTTIFRAINPGGGSSVNRGAGVVVTMLNTQVTGGRTRISAYDTAGYASSNYIEYVSGSGSLTTEGSTLIHGFYEVGLGVSGTKRLSAGTSGVAITGTLSNTTGAQFATSSGNVLIGTTTDAGQKLQVNGTSRFLNTLTGTSATFTGTIIGGQNDGNSYNHTFNGGLGTITFTRFDSYANPNFVVITQPNYSIAADGTNLLVTHNTNTKSSGSAIAKIKGSINGAGSSILEVGSGTNSVNSSHTSVLKVYSNGMDYFGTTYSGLKYIGLDIRYQGSTANFGTTSGTSVVSLYIQSNFSNRFSSTFLPLDSWKGLHENSVFDYLITPYTSLDITPTFTNTRPDTTLIGLNIQPSLGGYTGFTAIQSVVGDVNLNVLSGTTNIGTSGSTGFKLFVSGSTLLRGSGTTSASYALATQNSSGGTTMVVNNAGNVLIGTTTDNNYRLYVNGLARFYGSKTAGAIFGSGDVINLGGDAYMLATSANGNAGYTANRSSTSYYASIDLVTAANISTGWSMQIRPNTTYWSLNNRLTDTTVMAAFTTGNFGIGTTTDAGFKLDINGTTRFSNSITGTSATFTGTINGVVINYSSAGGTVLGGPNTTRGTNSVALGFGALYFNSGSNNVGIGFETNGFAGSASNCIMIGTQAGRTNTASNNIGIGVNSLGVSSGQYNVSIGISSQLRTQTGNSNISIGGLAGYANSYNNSVAIGYEALKYNSTTVATFGNITGGTGYVDGYYPNVGLIGPNTSLSYFDVYTNITISGGSVVDVQLVPNRGGTNVAVGEVFYTQSGYIGGSGSGFFVSIGSITTGGGDNVAIGYQSLTANYVGFNNTAIGSLTKSNRFSNSILIGKGAEASGNNQIVFGSSGTTVGPVSNYGFELSNIWKVKVNGTDYQIPLGTLLTNNILKISGSLSGTSTAQVIGTTLVSTGHSQTLIGLDIQPNFNRASYTGTTAIALRVSGNTQIIGSGSTGTTLSLFSVDGASGRLFDVTDDFTNSLFSVNTSSGVPVIEAFANNSIVMGTYGSNTLVVSGTSVNVGTKTSNSTSILNVVSTTKGVQFPRMTTTQKNSLTGATDIVGGLVVYDTDTNKLCCYNGTTWNDLF